jgi:hypothetical protein
LEKVEKDNNDSSRELAFIDTPKGVMLVWTNYGVVTQYDEDEKVQKALGQS